MQSQEIGEEAIVVDEHDNIIQYKLRSSLATTDRIRVSAIWLTNPEGKVLIAQRAFHKSVDPGKWGPSAAGTVAKGESYEDNAYKELAEELGLTNIRLRFIKKLPITRQEGEQRFIAWFAGDVNEPSPRLVLEDAVAATKWVDKTWLSADIAKNPDTYTPSVQMHWPILFP